MTENCSPNSGGKMPNISTLVQDIYNVIDGKGGWDATVSEFFKETVSSAVDLRLADKDQEAGADRRGLRLSNMGTPCVRKLWYICNPDQTGGGLEREPLPPHAKLKFLYGDILEALLISLAKAAGHRVEGTQTQLHVGDIRGHRDCVIDGITVDVKSASSYSFNKFRDGRLREDDPFGYVSQLSSYVYAGRSDPTVDTHPTLGAFLVVDKTLGHICLDMYDFGHEIDTKEEDFEEIKRLVSLSHPPPRAYEDEDEGKSGNRKLGIACSYCEFKQGCWPGLRTFKSSRGPVFLTNVEREPKMEEVT
jgi:hypothetical protein